MKKLINAKKHSTTTRKMNFFPIPNLKEESSMTKSKFLALTLAVVMALSVCFSGIVLANNEYGPVGPIITEDEANPVQVAITKNLRTPIGTTTPTAEFTFEARKISFDDDDSQDTRNNIMPDLRNLTINFTSANTGDLDGDGILNIILETGNILDQVIFPNAGVYIYEIRENNPTNPNIDDNEPYETLKYSDAVYTLRVFVKNSSRNDGTTFVFAVAAIVTTIDNNEQTQGYKVDPTPEGGEDYDFSQMIFTNEYVKTNAPVIPDNPDPITESTLNVTKTVIGDLGNRNLYFNFSMELNIPILVEDIPEFYKAYIVETTPTGQVVVQGEALHQNIDPSLVVTVLDGLDFVNISTVDSTAFKLKHNQRLVFVDTPVGTSYHVTEAATPNYISGIEVITDSITVHTFTNTDANLPVLSGLRFVGESVNRADFKNERASVVPTGLSVINLPFMGMIGLAVLALAGFMIIKAKPRKQRRAIYK